MLTKRKVIQTIARLPEKFSLNELLGEIISIEEKENNHDRGKDSDESRYQGSHTWFG